MSKIATAFHQVCQQHPDLPAFYFLESQQLVCRTFRQVEQDVQLATQILQKSQVHPGDRLLAFASPSYYLVIFILAAFQVGATVMYIDVFARQDTLARLFQQYGPQYLLVSNCTRLLKYLLPAIRQLKQTINVDRLHKTSLIHPITPPDIPDHQAALLTTTTGSTGLPKIVVRTHADLLAQLELIKQNIQPCEAHPTVLTTSYIYVFANLLQGFSTILPGLNLRRSSSSLNRKLQHFRDLPINMIITSPDFCLKTNNIYPHLEHLYFGGAILNLVEAERIYQKFRPAKITYIYGCTECNLISTNLLERYIADLQTHGISNLGRAVRGVQVRIGSHDEICVQSTARTDHYLGQDQKKLSAYYDTSDRGYLRNGELIYLGKANSILHTPLGVIYSSQVEQTLVLRFCLSKCAILEHQQKYYLFIENQPQVDLTELTSFLQAEYQISAIIRKVKKIPCDVKHHTKINYQELRQRLK